MNGYFINFIVYTLAMIGVMLLSVVVYKKAMSGGFNSKKGRMIKIEESLGLTPKKTLYVVSVDDEKFLIASDTERTSFLAKLKDRKERIAPAKEATVSIIPTEEMTDKTIFGIKKSKKKTSSKNRKAILNSSFQQVLRNSESTQGSVMKNLAVKIKRGI